MNLGEQREAGRNRTPVGRPGVIRRARINKIPDMRNTQIHGLTLLILVTTSTAVIAERRDVVEAGAIGDGKTDCTVVFQQLLNEAGEAGGGIGWIALAVHCAASPGWTERPVSVSCYAAGESSGAPP